VLLIAASAFAWTPPEPYPPTNEIRVDNRVAVPMRDGVILYADVYRPIEDGKYPVIVSRTPYSTERAPSSHEAGVFFSRRGYVYVFQDVRGRHESDGKWEPFRNDIDDGYDTIEWAGTQPWSNGKVGMEGGSYLGQVQWRAAQTKPPHLVAIFPSVASTSIYHDWITVNGGWRLAFNFGWGPVRQESRIMQNTGVHTMAEGPVSQAYTQLVWHLPLNTMQELAGRHAQFYKDWIAHPDYDDYWKLLNVEERFSDIQVPVHTMGGFFDIFGQGTLRGYQGVAKHGANETARKGSNMVIGPWEHGASRRVGDADWGENSVPSEEALVLRWYDYWLKGQKNGLDREPPVKIFVMGRNDWRLENEYPIASTQYKPLYFSSGGKANGSHGDGALRWEKPTGAESDTFTYDPANPVPSLGGANCCGVGTSSGVRDQRPIEHRGDILIYTSEILEEPVEVVGPVKLKLFASSDAVDTDFVAKLVDVHPDGKTYNACEGILRARYRNSLSKPEPLEPGKVYEMEIDLIGTAIQFGKGHRIRVHLTSSHFPQFSRNLNTGEPFGTSNVMKKAQQTVYHTSARPSHILLPVVP
jgi:putative CocE/NonD family hydrolase